MTLSPRARALLEAHRRSETPPKQDLERVFQAVNAAPVAPPAPGLDVDPSSLPLPAPGGAAGILGAGAGAKILAVTIAVAVPASWWATHTPDVTRAGGPARSLSPPAVTEKHVEATPPAPSALQLSDLPLPDPAAPPGRQQLSPESSRFRARPPGRGPVAPRDAASGASAPPAPWPSPSAPADPLSEEVALLAAANAALASKNAAGALALLDEHRTRFPRSRLAGTRDVTRALALCGAGRLAEGRAAAVRILRANPDSPFADRLRSTCGN